MADENIFNSVTDFHTAYMQGLDVMLQDKNLDPATFNLVFGNAILHHKERNLIARLEEAKSQLTRRVDNSSQDEDTKIFLQLKDMKLDWQNWTMVEDKKINSWNIQLNKFRVLKPKGFGIKKITEIFQKFDEKDFNFNKVKNPALWKGSILNRHVSLYYNKFPYKDLQSLLVLDPELNKEQFLTEADHRYIWNVSRSLRHLYNLYIGYNSMGAFASVNHLHFHLLIGIEELTVVQNKWSHNGGSVPYPATVYVFTDVDMAWNLLKTMHANNIAYNLLYTPDKLYVFPRRFQGTYEDPLWSTGLGWYELSGNFILYGEEEMNALTDDIIRMSLGKASLKWAPDNQMATYYKVASKNDVKEGKPFCTSAAGKKISLYKIGDNFYAISGVCTHAGGPLCEGEINGTIATCPWHGSKFDVTTGQVQHPPAIKPIQTYKTRVNGENVEIEMEG